jgi:hypothetical protein
MMMLTTTLRGMLSMESKTAKTTLPSGSSRLSEGEGLRGGRTETAGQPAHCFGHTNGEVSDRAERGSLD